MRFGKKVWGRSGMVCLLLVSSFCYINGTFPFRPSDFPLFGQYLICQVELRYPAVLMLRNFRLAQLL